MADIGIVGWGAYIPRYRIKVESIAATWGADPENYKKGLQLNEKSVPGLDQDTITLSVEAARYALKRAGIKGKQIGAAYVGSESHPYAVKPTGTFLAEAIGATPECHTADFEFACKAGTEAMYVAYAQVKAGLIEYGIGCGADTSQGAPGDALEYSASAGAAAFVFGAKNVVARVDETYAYMTETGDFWRREHEHYPQHAGRFTGEPAYFKHTLGATEGILKKSGAKIEDFDFVVFHQPNGKFPMMAGQKLGIPREKLLTGWLVPWLGNTYSGASPLGLTAILDVAKPGNKILMVSFGSGAGSDAFIYTVTDHIKAAQAVATPKTRPQLDENKFYLEYGQYAKFRGKIIRNK